MGAVWYATVEQVKTALDVEETARADSRIRRALASATDSIHGQMRRRFYPETATRYANWPNFSYAAPWRLYLDDDDELDTLTALVSGGVTLAVGTVNLEPANSGPPYRYLEVQTDGASAFQAGSTRQRAVEITGVFAGARVVDAAAGALEDAVASTSATTVNVTDSSEIGTGSVIMVGDERMIVTRRGMLTTGQALVTPVAADNSVTTIAVTDGTKYFPEETLLLDAERMLVVDVAGNNLIVRRAWDGSVLASHTASTIYAPRALTVERGALGTTAATHLDAAVLTRWVVPPLINSLAIAEAMVELMQGEAGYARTVGSGDNEREARGAGLTDLRKRAAEQHAKSLGTRVGAV